MRNRVFGVLALVIVVLTGTLTPPLLPVRATSAEQTSATDPLSPEALTTALGPRWFSSSDVAFATVPDFTGLKIFSAKEAEGFAWRPLATIQPSSDSEFLWTGYSCVTGTGHFLVTTVAPTLAANKPALRDHGAFAYAVDTRNGAVRPLASNVSLKYHTPGCGLADTAAVTRNTGVDQESTDVLLFDLSDGGTTRAVTVAGQVTSAIPVGDGVIAAQGRSLVRIATSTGDVQLIVKLPGAGFSLRPSADGGVNLLATAANDSTTVLHEADGSLVRLGGGPRASVGLFAGRAGHAFVTGTTRLSSNPYVAGLEGPSGAMPQTVSLDGHAAITAVSLAGQSITPAVFGMANRVFLDRTVPDAAPATSVLPPPMGESPPTTRSSVSAGPLVNTSSPVCAVPRNDVHRQVLQPNRQQADWAAQMAVRNLLTTGNGYSRPANYANMGLVAYAPNSDFTRHELHGWTGTPVPPSVIEAIMAQESAWYHASRHALPGIAGNPTVADYYGAAGTVDTINYDAADCGYGIAQVTKNMRLADTGYSANGKAKVAVDYAENIAAGLQILQDTWNQLYDAGIKANNADPHYLENWYMAIWAYNTGVQPTGAGCTPSPTCTDNETPTAHWGLGWTNNPQNADYNPARHGFLRDTYADAAHPGDWPYQERVFGWMETPLLDYRGNASYARPLYGSGSTQLHIPSFNTFCTTAVNQCDPNYHASDPSLSYCTLSDRHCWWHNPVSWAPCPSDCAQSGFSYATNSTEPSTSDPHPPVCNVDSSQLPASPAGAPIVVDDVGEPPLNVVGCYGSGTPPRNWTSAGTFAYSYGTDSGGAQLGAIDTHQLGAGFAGRILFNHTRSAATPSLINTGTWTPTLPSGARSYNVKAHIPATGAQTPDARYTITSGSGASTVKVINQHLNEDRWVSLGNYVLQPGATVVLTNQSSQTPGAFDVAYDAMAFTPLTGSPTVHTFDAVGAIDPNQQLDTAGAGYPYAKPLNSMTNIAEWGHRMSDTLGAPGLQDCRLGVSHPCVGAATQAVGQELQKRVVSSGSATKNPFVNGVDDTEAQWMALANARPAPQLTDAAVNDLHAWKIRLRLTVSFYAAANGTIDPASIDIATDAAAGSSSMADFLVGYIQAFQSDYGIQPPDLTYTAKDLTRYSGASTVVDPLNGDHSAPGRAYRPYIAVPLLTTGDSCVHVKSITGGAAGYKPMVLNDAVRASAGAWKARVDDAASQGQVVSEVADAADQIYKVQFKAGNSVDPVNGLNSPWWFAPPIWTQVDMNVCTSGQTFRPAGVTSLNSQSPRIAYGSFMPSLYLWADGTQLVDLVGAPLAPVSPLEASPAQTGNVYDVSEPPSSYPGNIFVADNHFGVALNPWDDCNLLQRTNTNAPADDQILRNGSPWPLSFYSNTDDSPSSVRLCDDPAGTHHPADDAGG